MALNRLQKLANLFDEHYNLKRGKNLYNQSFYAFFEKVINALSSYQITKNQAKQLLSMYIQKEASQEISEFIFNSFSQNLYEKNYNQKFI